MASEKEQEEKCTNCKLFNICRVVEHAGDFLRVLSTVSKDNSVNQQLWEFIAENCIHYPDNKED